MNLSSVDHGDIVHVNHLGRRFFAFYAGRNGAPDMHKITPLDKRITWMTAKSNEVIGIYRRGAHSALVEFERGQRA